MKKLIAMAAVAMTMMMASCSGDDSESTDNPSENGPLLTKMIETFDDGSYTTTYHYNGNKLVSITGESGGGTELTYTSDKLTKMESFSDDGELQIKEIFQYHPDGKLAANISSAYFGFELPTSKTTYTHNSNGTISYEVYLGDETSQTELTETGTIIMQNGNVVSVNSESDGEEYIDTFTYDNKNAPLKNIHAYDVIVLTSHLGVNNVLTAHYGEEDRQSSSTYTYNADGYPITSTDTEDGEFDGDYEYFYN